MKEKRDWRDKSEREEIKERRRKQSGEKKKSGKT